MRKSFPLRSGPASRFSFPPSSSVGSQKQGLLDGPNCLSQPRRFPFSFWASYRRGRTAFFSKTSPHSFPQRRRCVHPAHSDLPEGPRPAKNHPIPRQNNCVTRQFGPRKSPSGAYHALTLSPAYRILQIRAAPRRVAQSKGSIYADSGDRENLAQRKVDQLGRRQVARPSPFSELPLRALPSPPF